MTNRKINIAITESLGINLDAYKNSVGGSDLMAKHLTDYCNDLNAMHTAEEEIIKRDLHSKYREELYEAWRRDTHHKICCNTLTVIRATARQRAEAYLKTIGKWENQLNRTQSSLAANKHQHNNQS